MPADFMTEIFGTVRAATRALYPEARIPETPPMTYNERFALGQACDALRMIAYGSPDYLDDVGRIEPGAEYVVGDPDRLEQALQNLAANALRHTPDGGQIHLAAKIDAAQFHITVRDTGPGVAPEHLPFIFDRFYKVDSSRKASGGSGLGLSIVKAIVERHGGTIQAANAPDGGALFTISLPRA